MASDPDMGVLDFGHVEDHAPLQIAGSAADLLRDGYDHPHRWLHNAYARPDDQDAAFLVGRGWSATDDARRAIAESGIPVMAVNDFPADGPKPRFFCTGDPPSYFGERLWTDPSIVKFCSIQSINVLRPRPDAYTGPPLRTTDAPNVHYFHAVNDETEIESWLHLPYIAWGTTVWGEHVPAQFFSKGAARSSMLIGLRLLWHLGFRRIYLLGCDCTPHHHPAPMYWRTIFHLLRHLRPVFDRFCYKVYQTNPDSHLRCFDFIDFKDALHAHG